MNIFVIGSGMRELKKLMDQIGRTGLTEAVGGCSEIRGCVEMLEESKSDVVFIDTDGLEKGGIDIAKSIRKRMPLIEIIFVSDAAEYAVDAFKVRASGYLLKPLTEQAIGEELLRVKSRLEERRDAQTSVLRVQTFGNFDVFYNGIPLHFRRTRSKEIFAYLVDRQGTEVNMQEIAAVLWPNCEYDHTILNLIHASISDIRNTLRQIGYEGILIKERNVLSINTDRISCDMYDALAGNVHARCRYLGEYMANYTWAEGTAGYLRRQSKMWRVIASDE
ncbi:MAG: response regulator [Synergistaceae bacterium]|nr:response regulator [Synergistaceae bacterium]